MNCNWSWGVSCFIWYVFMVCFYQLSLKIFSCIEWPKMTSYSISFKALSRPPAVLRWEGKGRGPRPWAKRGPARKKKKKKFKRRFSNFKQMKDKQRKWINLSQLEIRNYNDVTRKNMNTSCVVFFNVVFLKVD